jgi:hypothetical protein
MLWPLYDKKLTSYWLKVFALYALTEACIQLLFNFILNNFSSRPISNLEFHAIMWVFQCVMILPIWWVAHSVRKESVIIQIFVNLLFFFVYSYFWFGFIQNTIYFLHQHLQEITRVKINRLQTPADSSVSYQLLKHSFRLSWFFLANYFYIYLKEEEQRLQLAIANKELELKLLKWHLNPGFYFETINQLKQLSVASPVNCAQPILHLAKVMEYVIYESRENLISMPKEIHFLNDYVELINRQESHAARFTIITQGVYDKLKIAPLLLAGFIDKIVSCNKGSAKNEYAITLQFLNNTMLLRINGDIMKPGYNFFGANDSLYKRLNELYDNRFSYRETSANDGIELSLQLNE